MEIAKNISGGINQLNFQQQKELIKRSQLFDYNYYYKNNPDLVVKNIDLLDHYLLYGWKEEPPREPYENFDSKLFYLRYPQARGINPLLFTIMNRVQIKPKLIPNQQQKNFNKNFVPPTLPIIQQNRININSIGSNIINEKYWYFNHPIKKEKIFNNLKPLKENPKISVIIPSMLKKKELTERFIESLLKSKKSILIDVILILNNTQETYNGFTNENLTILKYNSSFNFSKINNFGASNSEGDIYLFANDDLEVIQDHWLEQLIEPFRLDNTIGVLGPMLINPDNSIQSIGAKMRLNDSGVIGESHNISQLREVQTLGGACIAIRKEVFQEIKGFNEDFIITHSDTALGLDVNNLNYKVIVNPNSKIKHYERSSRGRDLPQDTQTFWKLYSKDILKYSALDQDSLKQITTTNIFFQPRINTNSINHIVIVKLDHFGDIVMSLPVIRKLKSITNNITVICGSWSKSIFENEGIKDIVTLNFFGENGVMGGVKGLNETDKKILSNITCDLAIDLRVGEESRVVLNYINAIFKVGFKTNNKNNFLDVSLDYPLVKNLHNSQQLELLYSAIPFIQRDFKYKGNDKNTIVISPSASTPLKGVSEVQWVNIIKGLQNYNFKVILSGGIHDSDVLNRLSRTLKLKILPFVDFSDYAKQILDIKDFLAYIGNDTGPTHLISMSGVPTIELMVGLVPQSEFGGFGENTIILRGKTSRKCDPCYNLSCKNKECLNNIEFKSILWSLGQFLNF